MATSAHGVTTTRRAPSGTAASAATASGVGDGSGFKSALPGSCASAGVSVGDGEGVPCGDRAIGARCGRDGSVGAEAAGDAGVGSDHGAACCEGAMGVACTEAGRAADGATDFAPAAGVSRGPDIAT